MIINLRILIVSFYTYYSQRSGTLFWKNFVISCYKILQFCYDIPDITHTIYVNKSMDNLWVYILTIKVTTFFVVRIYIIFFFEKKKKKGK